MQNEEGLIRKWIEKADHDLGTAKLTIAHIPEYKDTICFHCQQAIEKYLKGYLIFLDIEFKYLHDLIYLLDLIKQKDEFPKEYYDMASEVEDFSIEVRYPGNSTKLERIELEDAIKYAEKFREHVLKKMDMI